MNTHYLRQPRTVMLAALLGLSALALAPLASTAPAPSGANVSGWKCQAYAATEDLYQPKICYWSDSHARGGSIQPWRSSASSGSSRW